MEAEAIQRDSGPVVKCREILRSVCTTLRMTGVVGITKMPPAPPMPVPVINNK
jgi:hypothetical protein